MKTKSGKDASYLLPKDDISIESPETMAPKIEKAKSYISRNVKDAQFAELIMSALNLNEKEDNNDQD